MKRRMLSVALLAVLLLGACGGDDDPAVDAAADDAAEAVDDATDEAAEPEIQKVSIGAKEYSFDAPKEIDSGTTEFTMKNEGKEGHIAVIAKIADGKTFADVTKALQTPPGSPPAGPPPFEEVAGIASVSPGLSSNVTAEIEPGSYLFACFLPSPDGAPHIAKGMVAPFTVTKSDAEAAPLPAAVAEVSAKDFSYTTDFKAKAGEQVITLKNDGTQLHEITLAEFAPGKGPGDLEAYFKKPDGPPPATFFGGPVVEKGGEISWKTPALVAGKTYVFMCLIPDVADGIPHAAKGMVLPVAVT